MERLPTRIDSGSQEFIRCQEKNVALVDDLKEKLAKVKLGGGRNTLNAIVTEIKNWQENEFQIFVTPELLF